MPSLRWRLGRTSSPNRNDDVAPSSIDHCFDSKDVDLVRSGSNICPAWAEPKMRTPQSGSSSRGLFPKFTSRTLKCWMTLGMLLLLCIGNLHSSKDRSTGGETNPALNQLIKEGTSFQDEALPFPRWGKDGKNAGLDMSWLIDAVDHRLRGLAMNNATVGGLYRYSNDTARREHYEKPSFHKVYVMIRKAASSSSTSSSIGGDDAQNGPLELWSITAPLLPIENSGMLADRARFTEPMLVKTLQNMDSMHNVQAALAKWGGLIFVVNYDDSQFCVSDHGNKIPIMTMSAPLSNQCRYAFPIPTYESIILANKRHASRRRRIVPLSWERAWRYPWSTRIRKAVWRGSPTGPVRYWRPTPPMEVMAPLDSLQTMQHRGNTSISSSKNRDLLYLRWKLCALGHAHEDWIDAKFAGTTAKATAATAPPHWPAAYSNLTPYVGPRMDRRAMQRYRAVIDVDGNSWSSRFGELLCSSSVVIKVDPQHVDYFYPTLQAWKHYIPVHLGYNDDLSNLIPIVQFAVADENAALVQRIVANANQWCEEHMTPDRLVADMSQILDDYAALMTQFNVSASDARVRRMILSLLDRFQFSRAPTPK